MWENGTLTQTTQFINDLGRIQGDGVSRQIFADDKVFKEISMPEGAFEDSLISHNV